MINVHEKCSVLCNIIAELHTETPHLRAPPHGAHKTYESVYFMSVS
jgi:hypothetical protein